MLRRKFSDFLKKWRRTKKSECLMVYGPRQVGKTYVVEKFGREEYDSFIEINFFLHPELKTIFDGSLEASEIYKRISANISGVDFIPGKTLIFLDEIQECPNARTALKFLAIDNRYDVVASGSLLGLHYKQIASIPVGYEKIVEMYSLDFEEFLWANGYSEEAVLILKSYFEKREKVPEVINQKYLHLFKEYMVVGGMPEAVNAYLESSSYQAAHEVQKKILASYHDDIAKYASVPEKQKINDCYNSIPRQLAAEYKKFQYKAVSASGSARKYTGSLDWLCDAGFVRKVKNVSLAEFPLKAYEIENEFKIYITDTGLLTAMYGFELQASLLKDSLKGHAKGGIYENAIFEMFLKKGRHVNYYKVQGNSQEIEFVFDKDASAVPVEVKSNQGSTVSLNSFMKKYKPPVAYKLINGNLGVVENKISIPHYMAMFL